MHADTDLQFASVNDGDDVWVRCHKHGVEAIGMNSSDAYQNLIRKEARTGE